MKTSFIGTSHNNCSGERNSFEMERSETKRNEKNTQTKNKNRVY